MLEMLLELILLPVMASKKIVINRKKITKSNSNFTMPEEFDQIFNTFMPNAMNTVQKQEEVVSCKGCGASNKIIVGKIQECEFCGALLNSED